MVLDQHFVGVVVGAGREAKLERHRDAQLVVGLVGPRGAKAPVLVGEVDGAAQVEGDGVSVGDTLEARSVLGQRKLEIGEVLEVELETRADHLHGLDVGPAKVLGVEQDADLGAELIVDAHARHAVGEHSQARVGGSVVRGVSLVEGTAGAREGDGEQCGRGQEASTAGHALDVAPVGPSIILGLSKAMRVLRDQFLAEGRNARWPAADLFLVMPKSKAKSKHKSKSKRVKASWHRRGRNKQGSGGAGARRVFEVIPRDGGAHQAGDGLYDDCPICQAMRAEGLIPDEYGAVAVDEESAIFLSLLMRDVGSRGPNHRAS